MAINKQKSSPLLKAGIIIISAMLVLAFTLPLISSNLFSGSSSNGGTTQQGQLDALATTYGSQVAGLQQMLASEPTSYTVLVNLGNTYFDWGVEAQKIAGQTGGDQPMWTSAASFYDRALTEKPGDPNVTVDAAIAHYYSGNTAKAITLGESAAKANPEFAPAYFNLAIFYQNSGRSADAVAAAQTYLKLDPNGNNGDPATMQSIISEASGASSLPATGSSTTTP